MVDGDGIVSKTLQENCKEFIPFLYYDKNVILFPTISYRDKKDKSCLIDGNCTESWKSIPTHKKELAEVPKEYTIIKRGYNIVPYSRWKHMFYNVLVMMRPTPFMEPYGIFRRSKMLPLYHPYYYNYGRNKEAYFRVLNTMNFKYRVLTLDFAIDLPHPRSEYDLEVRKNTYDKLSVEYISYFDEIYDNYCSTVRCKFYKKF